MAIEFNIDAALAKLGELAAEHGPQAVDLAAEVVRINAIGDLIGAGVGLVIAGAVSFAITRIMKAVIAEFKKDFYDQSDLLTAGGITFSVLGGTASVITLLVSMFTLADPWLWVALTNPKLALARDIFNKIVAVAS